MAKTSWDDARAQDAVRIEADGNQVLVGVDLLSTEYLKDNWKWAIPAAIIDGVLIYGTYELVSDITDDGGSGGSKSGRDNTSVEINGNQNNVTVSNSGDTSSESTTDSSDNSTSDNSGQTFNP
jgi:hypothetical protein